MNRRPPAVLLLIAILFLAACSSGSAPQANQGGGGTPSTAPSGTPIDVEPTRGPDQMDSPGPGGGADLPGNPKLVVPRPGQLNPHPVGIERLSVKANGRHVVVNAEWWSGVEPCTVLDSTAVTVEESTITISVREGTGKGEVACIDIAVLKVTVIDLGELEPGTYKIVADQGTADSVSITIG
jgi:hypothetical protein